MRRGGQWLVVLVLAGLAPAGPAAAETLRIATYNIANYNLVNRMADGVYRPAYPKPESEKRALRRVIRDLDADVLVLQEMGGDGFLEELRRDLRSEGCDYPFAALMEAEDGDRRLAALSRRPFVLERAHRDVTFPYFGRREAVRRGMLELRLAAGEGEGEVALFVVHLKSRYTERADDPAAAIWRGAEATALRERVRSLFPDPETARYVVLGDLNDGPRSRAVRAFAMRGHRTLCRLLEAADERGERWTHYYRRQDSYSRVDHVLVSLGLWRAVVDGRARVYDGPGVGEAGDHRPVLFTLQLD